MLETVLGIMFFISFVYSIISYVKINNCIKKFKKMELKEGLSGFEIASKLLEINDLDNMYIVETKNFLEERYDVNRRVIRMLNDSFHGTSIYDCILASYLAAHAILDNQNNKLLHIRNVMMFFVNVLVYISYIGVIIGTFIRSYDYIKISFALLFITIIFNMVTKKVEIESKKIIIKNYKELNLINDDNKDVIDEIAMYLQERFIANPIILIVSLFKRK